MSDKYSIRDVTTQIRTTFSHGEVARLLDAALKDTHRLPGSPRLSLVINDVEITLVQTHSVSNVI